VSEEGSVETSEEALDHGGERLFVPSSDLRLVAGCPGKSSPSSVALFLPRQVLSTPASTVHLLLSYAPLSGGRALNQRLELVRPHAGASEAEWPAVSFELQGTVSNRDAIGAKLTIQAGNRKLVRWITGGSSYLSSHDKRVVFGLGKRAPESLDLQIVWPNGQTQNLSGLKPGSYHLIRESPSN